MGQSPDSHLFYGYVWGGETSVYGLLHDDDEYAEDESGSGEWQEVLLQRRGVENPWTAIYAIEDGYFIDLAHNLMPSQVKATQKKIGGWNGPLTLDDIGAYRIGRRFYLDTTDVREAVAEWDKAKAALANEFHCDIDTYGAMGYGTSTAYIYVSSFERPTFGATNYRNDWNGPTLVDVYDLATFSEGIMDVWLGDFVTALDLPMVGSEWQDPPVGPGWFMVSSYG